MDRSNSQLPSVEPEEKKQNYFSKHHLVGYLVLAMLFIAAVGFIYKWQYGQPAQNSQICIQVITTAKNPQTGEIKEFPTPCDVPEGWERSSANTTNRNAIEKFPVTEYTAYTNSVLGFSIELPKNAYRANTEPFFVDLYTDSTTQENLVRVEMYTAAMYDSYPCSTESKSLSVTNGWFIYKSNTEFCAMNGIYKVDITIDTDRIDGNKIFESIKLKSVVQPKYHIGCNEEQGLCSLKSENKTVISNFIGVYESKPTLSYIGAGSQFQILGWDNTKVLVEGDAGDACWSNTYLYEIDLKSKQAKTVAEWHIECPNDSETDQGTADGEEEYENTKAALLKTITPYPQIKLD